MDMYETIKQTLLEVEKKHNIEILYAAESGSRGWGFASPDSDYDCRFIYRNKKEFYLTIDEGVDYIELPVDKVYDVNGWDLKKALKALRKSNPTLLEWLNSPIVYIEKEGFRDEFIKLYSEFFDETATVYHYLHIAKKKFNEVKEEGKLKKYFYILRPLFACYWVISNKTLPPMEFKKLYDNMEISAEVKQEIERLLEMKKLSDESTVIKRNEVLMQYFQSQIEYCEEYLKTSRKKYGKDNDHLNKFFLKWIEGDME